MRRAALAGAALLLALGLAACTPSSELARAHGRGMGETMQPLDAEAFGRAIVDEVLRQLRERQAAAPPPPAEPLPRLPAPPAWVPPAPTLPKPPEEMR